MNRLDREKARLQRGADNATKWIGSTGSLITHTILFAGCFLLIAFGINFERVMLVLTTIVSLEAIYLAIFIQMTVNKNTADIEDIAEDVEDIQEDVDEIQEDVDEIQEDIDEIQEDVEEIQEDVVAEDLQPILTADTTKAHLEHDLEILSKIENALSELKKDIELLKKK